jgi:ATP-dependent DNA helicase RecQ
MRKTNLTTTQIRVIKADLANQKIIREVTIGKGKKMEYIPGAPRLDTQIFEELRAIKTADLEKMLGYIETTDSRMKYLCNYLGDDSNRSFCNCDNTGLKKIRVIVTPEWTERLTTFRENYFPEIEVEGKGTNLHNGVAASFYGFTNVGAALHRSKYENGGDFPDFLLRLVIKAYHRKLGQQKFDLMVYVPPPVSGNLVRNFAKKAARILDIALSDKLTKRRLTREQKVFENHYLKHDNVEDAFIYDRPEELEGKNILLIDDIFDSGATVKEIGKYLTGLGAASIVPLIIARTVGGDLHD